MTTARLTPVPWHAVSFTGGFWGQRLETNRTATLPHAFERLHANGVLEAYKWDWWPAKGSNPPWCIIVGDLAKCLEAASYSLATHPDAKLRRQIDEGVAAMVGGQKPNGYLFPNPMRRGQPWTNLQEYHELYEVGHNIEAAVAHHQATGSGDLLEAICRSVDLVDRVIGPRRGQKRGYPGHPEIELALVKLYRVTGERRYLNLAKYFVNERGRKPNFFEREAQELARRGQPGFGWYKLPRRYWHNQAHEPLRQQQEAAGHAVRALYLYSGAADVAAETGDAELLETCRRLWRSVTERRMYITGGVGSAVTGEAFSFDYDLPNETAYAETCANIALVLFAHRMLQIEADVQYADVMERALYNGVLSGVGLDGRHFFYANHLTNYPAALQGAPGHIAGTRSEWFGCACCPPNVARLLASLGQYVYSTGPEALLVNRYASRTRGTPGGSPVSQSGALFVHLYAGGSATCRVAGQSVDIKQQTDYPWDGRVALTVSPAQAARFTVALRIPGWCRGASLRVNGSTVELARIVRRGYAHVTRRWHPGDHVELNLPMPVERIEAHPRVRMDSGKVALQRGPIVYCLEEADNGQALADIALSPGATIKARRRAGLLGDCTVLEAKATRREAKGWDGKLYRAAASRRKAAKVTAVPYCLWANRGPGEMTVWLGAAAGR